MRKIGVWIDKKGTQVYEFTIHERNIHILYTAFEWP